MKGVFVVLCAGLCAFALGESYSDSHYFPYGHHIKSFEHHEAPLHHEYPYKKGEHHQFVVDDKHRLQMQKEILMLYKYINQPYYYYKEHADIVNEFSIEQNIHMYTNKTAVEHFLHHYHQGMLPRGEIFSVFYDYHLAQAISVFHVLYYAQDYPTFYKTAVYLHGHINEGMFLYALSVAITHKPEMYGIVIPPIYEVYPHYFFGSEVIQKAHQYKMQYYGDHKQSHGGHTFFANYSGWYLNLHPEQHMSYFTEDVGINMYYWYFNILYPFWMDSHHYHLDYDRRGEQFYYFYQQLIARYYLERLSNHFGQIPFFDWEGPMTVGYHPSLTYPNGMPFPERPHFARLSDYFYNYGQNWQISNEYSHSYSYVVDFERRIRDAIDAGFVYSSSGEKIDLFSPHGFEVLAAAIEGSADSPHHHYYGSMQIFARHLLGYSYQPYDQHHIVPSALEHFETSMRDPAFYMYYSRLVWYFQQYKSYLSPYTFQELYFPGVKVQSVEFDRLITYFDYFDSDISNAMYVSEVEYEQGYKSENYHVFARQMRLNHKPFNYKIHVNAENGGESVVKMYIGPKYDQYGRPYSIHENRINFVQFDEFKYTLKSGENVIERSSHENNLYAPDRVTYSKLFEMVESAYEGSHGFQMDKSEYYYGFPMRYLLPKGTYGGLPFQIYVIVVPYHEPHTYSHEHLDYFYPMVGTGAKYIDSYPLGFPFDRPVNEYNFFVPNSYFHDVVVYHRHYDEVHESH